VEEPANLPSPKTSPLVFTPRIGAMIQLPPASSLSNPGTLPIASQALPLPSGGLHLQPFFRFSATIEHLYDEPSSAPWRQRHSPFSDQPSGDVRSDEACDTREQNTHAYCAARSCGAWDRSRSFTIGAIASNNAAAYRACAAAFGWSSAG